MNLPIYWGVIALPAKQIVQQTSQVAASTSQLFGNLMRAQPMASANGLLGEASSSTPTTKPNTSKSPSWDERLEIIRDRLRAMLERSRAQFGLYSIQHDTADYSIRIGTDTLPVVHGPEPLRSDVENAVLSDGVLVSEMRSLVLDRQSRDPFTVNPNVMTIGFSAPR